MGILDELESKKNKLIALQEWIDSRPQKERDEWIEALRARHLYTNSAIAKLLMKKGFDAFEGRHLENLVYRYRGSIK